jgi:hypothetical protein
LLPQQLSAIIFPDFTFWGDFFGGIHNFSLCAGKAFFKIKAKARSKDLQERQKYLS